MSETLKGSKKRTSGNSLINALSGMIEYFVRRVNTADMVVVKKTDNADETAPAGNVDVLPLVAQWDPNFKTIPMSTIFALPYFRMQAGKAAIIMPPQPGDKGLAVYSKRDSSNVTPETQDTVHPGSFREFDMADGFVFTGFSNQAPEYWIKIDPETGNIDLSTSSADIGIMVRESGNINIKTNAGDVNISGTSGVTVSCPTVTVDGNLKVTGGLIVEGTASGADGGALKTSGGISNSGGAVESNGVSLEQHIHGGVRTGDGTTGRPQ